MSWLFELGIWLALVTLTLLEIVLGVDNIIFIAILAGKLPTKQQGKARITGLALAMITRIALLFSFLSSFVDNHPTIKILALSFLLLIGMALVGEGLDMHIPKGYIYFAIGFSVFVEMLNLKIHKKQQI